MGERAVTGQLYGQINELVGNNAAIQIQGAIKNVELSENNVFVTIFGVIMLLIAASGVFAEIQSSINYIWGLYAKPNKGLKKFIQNRLISFSMIVSLGFLMIVSLILNSVLDIISVRLKIYFPESTIYLFYVINLFVVLCIIGSLFAIIFRTLPDGIIKWKDAFFGAACTAILFMIGKFAISYYLRNSTVGSLYGAAGSVIIILVWGYCSSIILYFGAEFTKVYAKTLWR